MPPAEPRNRFPGIVLPKKNIDTDLSHPMAGDTRQVVERMTGSYGGGAVTHYFDITGGGCCTGNGELGTGLSVSPELYPLHLRHEKR